MVTTEAKYGYTIVIKQARGLKVEEMLRGNIEEAQLNEDIPVWRSKDAAWQAAQKLVPEGVSPPVYASLTVEATYSGCPEHAVRGYYRWMD